MTLESHPIDRSRVIKVYTGKQGCMCGCKGKYRYTSATQDEGGARRGYEVADSDVNEGVVTRVLNQVLAATNVAVIKGLGDEVIYTVDNAETGRRLAIYTKAAEVVSS
jgi:hypothetical protein